MTNEQMMMEVLHTYDELSEKSVLTPEEARLLELCGAYIDVLGLALATEYAKALEGLDSIGPVH